MTSKAQAGLNPLGELLGDVLARLEALESKICGGALTATSSHKATAGTLSSTGMTAAAAVSSASTSRVKIQPVGTSMNHFVLRKLSAHHVGRFVHAGRNETRQESIGFN